MRLTVIHKAFLAIIVSNIIWGAAAPIFKLALQNIPPFTLAFWRFFIGAFILLAVLGPRIKLHDNTRRDMIRLFWYAITGITINIMFFFWGLQRTLSINSPIIVSGSPILIYFLAIPFLHEKPNIRKLTGMLIGVIGIFIIVLEPLLATGLDGNLLGNVFLVIATVAAVVQTIIGKKAISKFNPFAFTFWAFLIGSASFLPLAIWEYAGNPAIYSSLDWRGYMGILYGAAFSSATAYGLYAWGLSKIQATDASLFSYIDPVAGGLLAYFMLHEPITPYLIAGSVLIFGGIFVAEGRLHYHPVHKFLSKKQPDDEPPIDPSGIPVHTPVNAGRRHEVLSRIFTKQREES